MPEDATLAAAGFLFCGAVTTMLLNYCAARAGRYGKGNLSLRTVVIAVFGVILSSGAAVMALGAWARPSGASMSSWIVLLFVWIILTFVYFTWRLYKTLER